MRQSTKQFILIALLGFCLFSFPVFLVTANTDNFSLLASQVSGGPLIKIVSSKQDNHETSAPIAFQSRWELYELLFGTHMVIVGLVAMGLALYRWKANDLSLISFGIFCFFYGARTRAFQFLANAPLIFWAYWHWFLTYATPVPAYIFLEQFIGHGWKSSMRRIWQIQIAFAILAALADLFLHSPGASMAANNVMAIAGVSVVGINLFRPGLKMNRELRVLRIGLAIFGITALYENITLFLTPGNAIKDLEPFGFLVFLGSLVYIVAYRFFRNEKDLITITHELETARQIQHFILPRKNVDIKGISLAAHYVPMSSVAGDFYDFLKVDDKHLGILVADVSGHGVPASLISSMVKIAFSSQLPCAYNPAKVLAGINQVLCGNLESDFVTAGYLFMDTENQTAAYAGAGHPPMLLWRGSEQRIYEYGKKGIILGQFEEASYQNVELRLKSGDRFLLYTDGIIETTNTSGELYGLSRFKKFVTSHASRSVANFSDALIQHISNWSGKHLGENLDDDLTLVVADFEKT